MELFPPEFPRLWVYVKGKDILHIFEEYLLIEFLKEFTGTMGKTIETATAHISLIEANIVKIQFKQDVEVDLEDVKQNHEASQVLAGGNKHLVLLDVRGYAIGSDKAKVFSASKHPASYRIAVATLVSSLAARLRGNAYIRFNKPKVPTRLFSQEQKAIEWLKEFQVRG